MEKYLSPHHLFACFFFIGFIFSPLASANDKDKVTELEITNKVAVVYLTADDNEYPFIIKDMKKKKLLGKLFIEGTSIYAADENWSGQKQVAIAVEKISQLVFFDSEDEYWDSVNDNN